MSALYVFYGPSSEDKLQARFNYETVGYDNLQLLLPSGNNKRSTRFSFLMFLDLHIYIIKYITRIMRDKKTCIQTGGLTAEYLGEVSQFLKMLSHPHRLKIIEILEHGDNVPVHEIVEKTGLAQAAVSLHLNSMKRMGILESDRKGREVWYKIKDQRAISLLECICKNCPTEEIA